MDRALNLSSSNFIPSFCAGKGSPGPKRSACCVRDVKFCLLWVCGDGDVSTGGLAQVGAGALGMLARGIDGAAEAGFPADAAAAARAELWGVMVLGPVSMNVVQALVQVTERALHGQYTLPDEANHGQIGCLDTLSLAYPFLAQGGRCALSCRSHTNESTCMHVRIRGAPRKVALLLPDPRARWAPCACRLGPPFK